MMPQAKSPVLKYLVQQYSLQFTPILKKNRTLEIKAMFPRISDDEVLRNSRLSASKKLKVSKKTTLSESCFSKVTGFVTLSKMIPPQPFCRGCSDLFWEKLKNLCLFRKSVRLYYLRRCFIEKIVFLSSTKLVYSSYGFIQKRRSFSNYHFQRPLAGKRVGGS